MKRKGRFEYRDGEPWFRIARPVIRLGDKRRRKDKRGEGWVQYRTGYRYNGGTIVNDTWVKGFLIAEPRLPRGFRLRCIGVLLQLNNHPPIATSYLERIGV